MIRARGVFKSYRTGKSTLEVLRGVDLEVADGEFVAVMGRSGSGKSTLLGILGGLDTDYTGSVTVAGRDLHKLSDVQLSEYRNTSIGFVFQAFHLLDHLSCRDNVALPALFVRGAGQATSSSEAAARARADELLARVGIPEKATARPSTLSGGQKQRLAIARALFHRPALLIGDEPTGNLDSNTAEDVLALFLKLCRDEKVTLVLVTHDATIARAADRVIEMHDGIVTPTRVPAAEALRSSGPVRMADAAVRAGEPTASDAGGGDTGREEVRS